MQTSSGVLWALQVIVGPLVLGAALVYATFQFRRRRHLQGEGNYTTREMMTYAIPVVAAVALLTFLLMIPGSR